MMSDVAEPQAQALAVIPAASVARITAADAIEREQRRDKLRRVLMGKVVAEASDWEKARVNYRAKIVSNAFVPADLVPFREAEERLVAAVLAWRKGDDA